METRTDGDYGGTTGGLTGPDPLRGNGRGPATLTRAAVDPTAVGAPTKSMRVVIGSGLPGLAGSGKPVGAPLGSAFGGAPLVGAGMPEPRFPGQRIPARPGRFGSGSASDLTAEFPAVRVRAGSGARPATRPRTEGERRRVERPAHARRPPLHPGIVLLPLRLFVGAAFLIEGLRKLYDPGFLDPSATGSFAHRIAVLRPGSFFPPVMDLAAQHAIGTGLLFAFGQVVVGFGVVLGLWTRLMGLLGMLLSVGVLIAVGTASSPYHAAYVVFLAAFSPLALAGASMYSADAWLSLRDWKGPLTTPVRARRRKLGYGSILACAGVGVTLLAGALYGRPSSTALPAVQDTPAAQTSAPASAPASQSASAAVAPAAATPPSQPPAAATTPTPGAKSPLAASGRPAAGTPGGTSTARGGKTPSDQQPATVPHTGSGGGSPAGSGSGSKSSGSGSGSGGPGNPLNGLLG